MPPFPLFFCACFDPVLHTLTNGLVSSDPSMQRCFVKTNWEGSEEEEGVWKRRSKEDNNNNNNG